MTKQDKDQYTEKKNGEEKNAEQKRETKRETGTREEDMTLLFLYHAHQNPQSNKHMKLSSRTLKSK